MSVRLRTPFSSLTPKVEFVRTQNNKQQRTNINRINTLPWPPATSCKEIKIAQASYLISSYLRASKGRRKLQVAKTKESWKLRCYPTLGGKSTWLCLFCNSESKSNNKEYLWECHFVFKSTTQIDIGDWRVQPK